MVPIKKGKVMNDEIKLTVRLPLKLKGWLRTRAAETDRSMNAEIISLLKSAMRADETNEATHA
jgi:plasmid stability protein